MQKGYIAIVTVLTLSAVCLMVAATTSLLALGEAQSGFSLYQGEDTLNFVEGCTEDGLMKSQNSSSYNGGTVTRPEGSCDITMDSKIGTVWTMTITTAAAKYKRTVRVVFTRPVTGSITINSWQEI